MKHRQRRKEALPRTSVSQSETKFSRFAEKSHTNIEKSKKYPHHEHPYATRSKSLMSSAACINCDKSERRLSESSIIFLGAFRKVPLVIDLDDTSQQSPVETRVIKTEPCWKMEPMDCQDGQEFFIQQNDIE